MTSVGSFMKVARPRSAKPFFVATRIDAACCGAMMQVVLGSTKLASPRPGPRPALPSQAPSPAPPGRSPSPLRARRRGSAECHACSRRTRPRRERRRSPCPRSPNSRSPAPASGRTTPEAASRFPTASMRAPQDAPHGTLVAPPAEHGVEIPRPVTTHDGARRQQFGCLAERRWVFVGHAGARKQPVLATGPRSHESTPCRLIRKRRQGLVRNVLTAASRAMRSVRLHHSASVPA